MQLKSRIIICVLALAMGTAMLTGCSSNSSSSTAIAASTNTKNADGNSQASGNWQSVDHDFNSAAVISNYQTALADLVKAGTITQDQSDKVMAALQSSGNQASQGQNAQSGGQSSGNRSKRGNGSESALSSLVSSGVITQAQADAINKEVRKVTISARYDSVLKNLVTAGTITQDQSDKVLAAVASGSSQTAPQTRSPQASGQAQGQSRSNDYESAAITQLVSSGVITQAQADAINQGLRSGMKGNNLQSPTPSQSAS